MYTKSRRLLLAALWLLATATAAFAQQTTGTIAGRVLDEQKAAVPGATVTAKNDSTGFTRTEVSDAEGLYRITGLPVGSYALSIEMSGFQPQKRTRPGQRLRDGHVGLRHADRADVGERHGDGGVARWSTRPPPPSAASSTPAASRTCR